MSPPSPKHPEVHILTLKEMWSAYRRWIGVGGSRDIQKILEMLFPEENLTEYQPEELISLVIYGLTYNGLDQFSEFIKAMTHGDSNRR